MGISQSLNQHKYMEFVAYGKKDATLEEIADAKDCLEADKNANKYQTGHAGIVGAIIKVDNKYLIQYHNKKDCWTICTGKVDPDESDEEALVREMFEELDIKITGTTYLGDLQLVTDKEETLRFDIFQVNLFEGTIKNKEPEKHARLKYCTKVELTALIKSGTASDLIKLVIDKDWI